MIPFEWNLAYAFTEGLACVTKKNDNRSSVGFIDTTGEIVIPFEWVSASVFREGFAPVQKEGKWGYIDTTGKLVIPCEWDLASSFSEGFAVVCKNNAWVFGLKNYVTIESPQSVVDGMKEMLSAVGKRYEGLQ